MLAQVECSAAQVAMARREFAEMAVGWRAVSAASAPAARAEAEVQIFNQMVVALEGWFAHLDLGGNAVTEVRLLAQGVATDGRFPLAARWRADASVTGYRAGDRIALTEEVFSRLAGVFLDGMGRRFVR